MIQLEKNTKLLTLSTVLILAILSGIAVTVYANSLTNGTNTESGVLFNYSDYYNYTSALFGRHGHGWGCGKWRFGQTITVSQEYKDNVISIAQNDTDVQNLLADGYNITDVRPIISTTVEADGTITMKATTAIVTLSQNATGTTGKAFVTVNVEEGKVTEIVILTRTVIEK